MLSLKRVLIFGHVSAGVLAVTRSLGDSSMKEFVVGSPYTTETVLGDEDDILILACDGVRSLARSTYRYLNLLRVV
jgi:serine/threonine protein phosphatase PrpC